MNVLLLTPWAIPCGVAEYAAYLVEAVTAADPMILLRPCTNPDRDDLVWADVVHLNHQQQSAGHRLEVARMVVRDLQCPLVVTQHDTFETFAIMQERGFPDFQEADALIVHEPVVGLSDRPNVFTWRQGVPARELPASVILLDETLQAVPILGTVGFPHPWKQYDLLAEATGQAGWGLVLIAPGATADQLHRWRALNPLTRVTTTFSPRPVVVSLLAGCTATAFLYGTWGSGTSAAIRQGLAARRPLFCTTSRQFRDLLEDPEAASALHVIPGTVQGLVKGLQGLLEAPTPLEDSQVAALADRDAWSRLGARYAQLYRTLGGD